MPPIKDPTPIYIEGPKMDWAMDEGLYTHFQDWRLECELILDGELAEIVEPHKVNTLIRWAGSYGLKTSRCGKRTKPNSHLLSLGKSLKLTVSHTQMNCELGMNYSNSCAKVQLLVIIGTQQYKINCPYVTIKQTWNLFCNVTSSCSV